jgi:hypothetical protein
VQADSLLCFSKGVKAVSFRNNGLKMTGPGILFMSVPVYQPTGFPRYATIGLIFLMIAFCKWLPCTCWSCSKSDCCIRYHKYARVTFQPPPDRCSARGASARNAPPADRAFPGAWTPLASPTPSEYHSHAPCPGTIGLGRPASFHPASKPTSGSVGVPPRCSRCVR